MHRGILPRRASLSMKSTALWTDAKLLPTPEKLRNVWTHDFTAMSAFKHPNRRGWEPALVWSGWGGKKWNKKFCAPAVRFAVRVRDTRWAVSACAASLHSAATNKTEKNVFSYIHLGPAEFVPGVRLWNKCGFAVSEGPQTRQRSPRTHSACFGDGHRGPSDGSD